jgi:hypothetical protein
MLRCKYAIVSLSATGHEARIDRKLPMRNGKGGMLWPFFLRSVRTTEKLQIYSGCKQQHVKKSIISFTERGR